MANASIRELWTRAEAWLGEHAPSALRALNPPARPDSIAKLEQELGAPLPQDLLASLDCHDGQSDLAVFEPWTLLSAEQLVMTWRMIRQACASAPFRFEISAIGPVQAVWWDDLWLPFAADGAGNDLCVDLHPADGGHTGQVVEYVHDFPERTVIAVSYHQWLANIVTDLESGHYVVGPLGYPRRTPRAN